MKVYSHIFTSRAFLKKWIEFLENEESHEWAKVITISFIVLYNIVFLILYT